MVKQPRPRQGHGRTPGLAAGLAILGMISLGACQQTPAPRTTPPAAPALPDTPPKTGAVQSKPAELAAADQKGRSAGQLQGHAATVNCLRGERGLTDGNELRCEAWGYVRENYLRR